MEAFKRYMFDITRVYFSNKEELTLDYTWRSTLWVQATTRLLRELTSRSTRPTTADFAINTSLPCSFNGKRKSSFKKTVTETTTATAGFLSPAEALTTVINRAVPPVENERTDPEKLQTVLHHSD